MKIKKFNELIYNYNSKLNKISKTDVDYKIAIYHAALIFFEGINKLDTVYIDYFLKNLDKDNIRKNKIHNDALNCFILLIVKNTSTKDLFVRFFPEYLEIEFSAQPNWRIVRWVKIFISWIFKPKPELCNLIEAKNILNACRNIKARVGNMRNDLLDFNSEIEDYNALLFIEKKILENNISPLIYNPINEQDLLASWNTTFKNKEYLKNFYHSISILEIDSLLKYLNLRIKSLVSSDEKKILSNKIILLKSFIFENNFSLFDEKIKEVMEEIKDKFIHKNSQNILGINNLIKGIRQRLKLVGKVSPNTNLHSQHCLTSDFMEQFYFAMDKIQFYFEYYRKNLEEQNEKCFVNTIDFYNKLNRLENFLYTNENLFHHTLSQTFDIAAHLRLALSLFTLQQIVQDLEDCRKDIDSKLLQTDLSKFCQFVSNEVLVLQTGLPKGIKSVSITNDSNEGAIYKAETYEEIDNSGSSISEALCLNIAQHSQIGKESPSDSLGYQSGSGISEEDESNLDQPTRSMQPLIATPFWHAPHRTVGQLRHCSSEACDSPAGWASSSHIHTITT